MFHKDYHTVIVAGRSDSPVDQYPVSGHVNVLSLKRGNRDYTYLIGRGIVKINKFCLKGFRFLYRKQTCQVIDKSLDRRTFWYLSVNRDTDTQ